MIHCDSKPLPHRPYTMKYFVKIYEFDTQLFSKLNSTLNEKWKWEIDMNQNKIIILRQSWTNLLSKGGISNKTKSNKTSIDNR
jgi:hypothetical protein